MQIVSRIFTRNRTSSGITALDLLVTMALVAIIAVAGLPGLHSYGKNQAIKASVSLLHSDLNLARSEAIKLNTRTVACPGLAATGCADHSRWHEGWLVFADMNGDRSRQDTEPLLRQANALQQLTATGSDSRRQILFYPNGSAPASNTSIVFCDDRGFTKGKKLVISNSGRIRRSELSAGDASRCPG